MTPAEKDNLLKWDGRRKGHYEVYYFKLNDPVQKVAFWLRYTLLIPCPGKGEGIGELWGIFFDVEDPSRNQAWKQTFPIREVASRQDRFELRIHSSILQHDMARGEIRTGTDALRWNLTLKPCTESFHNLPELLYPFPFPKTKVVAPNLSCTYSGTIEVGDRKIELSDAPGHQAHIWGTKHAARWAWANCNIFSDRQDAVFEAISAQIKLAGRLTPPMSGVYLRVGPDEYRFISYVQLFTTQSYWNVRGWQLEASGPLYQLTARVRCDPRHMVGVGYRDPDGETRVCNNSKVADLEVEVRRKVRGGKPELVHLLESEQCCAFEVVGPEAVPEVDVKI